MKIKKTGGVMVAAVTAAALFAPAATPAQASCTTIMIGDQKTCAETIPCSARDYVAGQNERVGAAVRKYAAYDCLQ
jgi:hypothetical protein